jgi:hypothetical protein|tara:strand:- start:558 stop:1220 length:663 start_codon:yes stop_codon:yes gene_type:complete
MGWISKNEKLEGDNVYHRHLKFPFEIRKYLPLMDTVPDTVQHVDINPYRDPYMEKLHEDLGLYIHHTEVFYTPPNGGELPIHTDEATYDDRAKINITWGPDVGTVRWWKSDKAKPITDLDSAKEMLGEEMTADEDFSERQHSNILAKKEDCTLVHEANTNTVSLINAGQLHSTWNPHPTEGRWTLCFVMASKSIRDGYYLTFEEACEVYKDYIIGDDNGN